MSGNNGGASSDSMPMAQSEPGSLGKVTAMAAVAAGGITWWWYNALNSWHHGEPENYCTESGFDDLMVQRMKVFGH
jgi:hypothetical protein